MNEKLAKLQAKAIKSADRFCDESNEIRDELMAMLPQKFKGRGKKVICDGMAVEKALVLEGLFTLCAEADRHGELQQE